MLINNHNAYNELGNNEHDQTRIATTFAPLQMNKMIRMY